MQEIGKKLYEGTIMGRWGMMGGATSPMLPPMDSPPALPMDQAPVPLKMKKTLSLVDDSDILDDLNLEEDGKLDLSDL